jgi:hypothetical protein
VLVRAAAALRTALVVAGLAFAAIEVGSACLDHVGEDQYGQCVPDSGADCGAAAPSGGSGSGTAPGR